MADRRCTADEAFEMLKRLSMDSDFRLADVAAALVYQVAGRWEPSECGATPFQEGPRRRNVHSRV